MPRDPEKTVPERLDDTTLDAVSGGPIEVRELHIRTTVSEAEASASTEVIMKGSKINQN